MSAASILRVSVIITTFNNPRGLSFTLAGLRRQTVVPLELLIADDGSGDDTKRVIDEARASFPCPIRHVWQPRDGFRKCTILNRAVLEAAGEYLVFFDGDCVPMRGAIAAHLHAARRNRYVTGGKVLLSREVSDALTMDDVVRGRLNGFGAWWFSTKRARRLMISRLPGIRFLFDRNVPRLPGWRGENASTFREHVLHVAGFDERFTYGYEDADFGHRLECAGVLGYSIRYTSPVVHLEHERSYVSPEIIAGNKKLYDENRALKMTVTPHGIREKA